jgi:hypothetical protein
MAQVIVVEALMHARKLESCLGIQSVSEDAELMQVTKSFPGDGSVGSDGPAQPSLILTGNGQHPLRRDTQTLGQRLHLGLEIA